MTEDLQTYSKAPELKQYGTVIDSPTTGHSRSLCPHVYRGAVLCNQDMNSIHGFTNQRVRKGDEAHVMGYYPGVERNEILFLVAYAGRRRITCKVR